MRIRIVKRSVAPGGLPAREFADHVPGHIQPAGFSLPVEYTIEGELLQPIVKGEGVRVNRDTRNGVKMPGEFTTSEVTELTLTTFRTKNSVYNFELIYQPT